MTSSAIDLEKAFKAGIAAYQKGDYDQAAAVFARLTKGENRTYQLKASMGVVQIYIAQRRWAEAKALCQKILQKAPMPAAQRWARSTLTDIDRQMNGQMNSQMANRVVVSDAVVPSDVSTGAVSDGGDKSGFQPITADSQTASSTPISAETLAKTGTGRFESVDMSSVDMSSGPLEVSAKSVDTSAADSPVVDTLLPVDETSEPQVSMFHYAYLNNEVTPAESDEAEPNSVGEGCLWTYAGRLDKGRSLGRIKRSQLRIAQFGSAIALYFLLRFLIHQTVAIFNGYLFFLDDITPFYVRSLPTYLEEVTWPLLMALLAVVIASPWLWDLYLRFAANRQKLSISQLRMHSAEAASLISQYCRQRQWKLPRLWKLSTDIPLVFSYGWLPRNARLVISDGLLSTLQADELADVLAYELSHWKSWHWLLLSAHSLLLQLLHQIYWQLALWGNKQNLPLKWAVGTIASLSYALFWLVRLPGLWVARVRTYYGDRIATEMTGDPNGLIRGLTKLSFGLAASIEQQGYTPSWIERLSLLMPVSADLSRQKLYGRLSLADLFAWDSKNPLRNWMGCLDSHPPLGDRLRLLTAYAKHWQLPSEILFDPLPRRQSGLSRPEWKHLFNQGTPYFGLTLGLSIGLALWVLGAIAAATEWPVFDWMHRDIGLFQCCLLLGTGVGILLRINRFFPDLPPSMQISSLSSSRSFCDHLVPGWIAHPELLPVDSLPVKLTGTLLGRPGIANWLGQDLCLQTSFGLIRLHFFSTLGPLGNLLNRSKTPRKMQGESVQITGWFRRGVHPWIDIHQIRPENSRVLQAGHPIYSLLLAAITIGLGLWLLLQSN
ncbi:M48 family metalloprotease [cf. Phormidesmis sp. LEGE 11477]|uniref:M48 family metalloprotease n=1 Tax=cf. Phormidesmis sp. LEGE 11477 TaxID=1828680 RepID=UPI001881A321|nr:M48 family metalloprotease [cf. Phormidesmis sp. LEGE 11477]MBE9061460.1 M48 family metalloprotease [cf. Phormidesmis sp. LEGE 11477]